MNPNTARAALAQRNANGAQIAASFYVYTIPLLAVAAGATASGSFVTQSDSDFEWSQSTFQAVSAGANVANPLALVQLVDTGSQNNLFLSPLPINAVFGTAAQPFILPVSKILIRNAQFNASVQNNGAAATDFYLVFIGQKVYR